MKWNFDLKYLLATAVAIASLIFPIYLWQSDLKAHALSVRLISSSQLQPLASSKIYDVKVTVNGVELLNPYFSVFEIVNSGSKPILSTDFESPIIFSGNSDLSFVSARVDLTEPKDIPVKVTLETSKVSIAPFLSNPADKVYLSVITSGADPVISIKARIAGIREIEIVDSSVATRSPLLLCLDLIVSLICLTTYAIHVLMGPRQINRGLALASMAGCTLGGSVSMKRFIDGLGVTGGVETHEKWIIVSLFLAVSFATAFAIKKYFLKNAEKQTTTSAS
ncbi:hypothetical protein I5P86_16500 [Pseudomonas glycinae]|uniref:hypothetical protein n=1 Tax=Pseudomonas glycinae TaxID=1785145 RepID=UPI0018D89186|nr:hypothetical protein [Pseudomonas glycinae]MBH3406662.1 hypothetical protein [Pseudomonas glycinae]